MPNRLAVAEIGALRNEVNSVVDRANGNENFCAGVVSAIFGFVALNPDAKPAACGAIILGLLVVILGVRRYWELKTHVAKVDAYLQRIEKTLDEKERGWTTYYYRSIQGSSTNGYSVTRWIFWIALLGIVIGTAHLSMFNI